MKGIRIKDVKKYLLREYRGDREGVGFVVGLFLGAAGGGVLNLEDFGYCGGT